ncbi:MAG: hypothetical protein ACMXYG_00390 [Candidatus Woesearchaeota archaeon]
MKKGQIVVYDFIFGFAIFIIIISMVSILWFANNSRVIQEIEQQKKMRVAHDIANILINSPGYPTTWDFKEITYCENNNCTFGLAVSHNQLSLNKFNEFKNFISSTTNGYNITRKSFKIYDTYDYEIVIRNPNGDIIEQIGLARDGNVSASISRLVFIGESIRRFEIIIH